MRDASDPDRAGEPFRDRLAARGEPPPSRALARGDSDYPQGLLALDDAPERVFVRGTLPRGAAVAIVGSRAATPYGLAVAHRLAADLAAIGVPIVSGLARGIDAAAHEGALEGGGPTIAVLPSGLDTITPSSHTGLATRIAARGALLTEIPTGGVLYPGQYLARNRLIAALAVVTVVVEAAESSGALNTAAAARRLGRGVLAVPGDVERATSRGCHALLRQGASVCEDARDVLAALGAPHSADGTRAAKAIRAKKPARERDAIAPMLDGDTDAARVARALESGGSTPDTLAAKSELPLDRVLAALVRLEWAGVAAARPGQRWARGAR